MQSDKDISSQVPPPIEELDKIMQGSDDDEEDKDKTAPPSPSLVQKETHLPPFQQIPYPMDMEELAKAPVQDWNALLPKHGDHFKMFRPEL